MKYISFQKLRVRILFLLSHTWLPRCRACTGSRTCPILFNDPSHDPTLSWSPASFVGVALLSGKVGELLGLWREEFPKGMLAAEYTRKRNQLRTLQG